MSLTGCWKTKPPIKEDPAVAVFWGTKEECKSFLDSPEAKSARWFMQSLGDK